MDKHWWSLPDLAGHLGYAHSAAASRYRDLSGLPSVNTGARCLLRHLAEREQRLAVSMCELANRADNGRRLPLAHPPQATVWGALPTELSAAAIIDLATAHEDHIESIVQLVAHDFGKQAGSRATAESIVAIHRRELFDLGVLAEKLRATQD